MRKEDAEKLTQRLMEDKFDFEDMLKQTKMLAKMGSVAGLAKFIPGLNKVGSRGFHLG